MSVKLPKIPIISAIDLVLGKTSIYLGRFKCVTALAIEYLA